MTPKAGQRLEEVVYYCDERKKHFKRVMLVDDDLEVRRQLSGTVLTLKTSYNGHKQLLVKSVQGKSPRYIGIGTKSLPALLFGNEHLHARRDPKKPIWDLTREAYQITTQEVS